MDAPLLFDLGPSRLTTRQVADIVRVNGTAGLTEAQRRADAATYQEVRCRSALNRVQGMPFEWTLNPYRGCTHACQYCYARRYQSQFALDSGDEFASVILAKTNVAQVLRRELRRPSWTGAYVAIGTATDCYQPIEGHYRITRQCLEAFAEAGTPVGVITKGPMVVRDIDVLQTLSARGGCTVYVSVPTVDEDAWRALEPGTAPPLQRLRAVRDLAAAGIRTGVLMNPIVPGLTSRRSLLDETVRTIAAHGAMFLGSNVLFLEGGSRDHFMGWLQAAHPALASRYDLLYARKYAPADYRRAIAATVSELRAKYGLGGREYGLRTTAPSADAPPEQRMLEWTPSA